MIAAYQNKQSGGGWVTDNCPSASILWPASRVLCGVIWEWDTTEKCYVTYQWSRADFRKDVRQWPAATALSSILRALREDDRLAGEPVLRWLALDIAIEYVSGRVEAAKL